MRTLFLILLCAAFSHGETLLREYTERDATNEIVQEDFESIARVTDYGVVLASYTIVSLGSRATVNVTLESWDGATLSSRHFSILNSTGTHVVGMWARGLELGQGKIRIKNDVRGNVRYRGVLIMREKTERNDDTRNQ